MNNFKNWFNRRGYLAKVAIITAAVFVALSIIGSFLPDPTTPPTTTTTAAPTTTTTAAPTTTTTAAPTTTTTAVMDDPAVLAYFADLSPIITDLGTACATMGDLAPQLLTLSPDEVAQMGAALAVLATMPDKLATLSPPPSMAPIHAKTLVAGMHYRTSALLLASGVDALDFTQVEASTASMALGTAALDEATTMVAAL